MADEIEKVKEMDFSLLLQDEIHMPTTAAQAEAYMKVYRAAMAQMVKLGSVMGLPGLEIMISATDALERERDIKKEVFDAWLDNAGELTAPEKVLAGDRRIKHLSRLAWKAVLCALMDIQTEFGHRRAKVEEYRLGNEAFDVLRGHRDHGVKFSPDGSMFYNAVPVRLLDTGHDRAIAGWSLTADIVVEMVVGGGFAVRKASESAPPSAMPKVIDIEAEPAKQ